MANDNKMPVFTVSDESLNSLGTWILTDGIDVSDFLKNPIMLWNHSRTWEGTKDEVLPIGIWSSLNVQKGAMTALPVFDMDDTFAAEIGRKVEKGFLKAASIGIRVIEYSEDPKYLKQGQKYPTITKCQLREISVVDIPSNKNCVAFYDKDGAMLQLGDSGENLPLPLLQQHQQKGEMDLNLKDTAKLLGLADTASMAEVNAAVAALKTENATLKAADGVRSKAERDSLIDAALADGRLHTDAQRADWEKLFDANADVAKNALAALPKVKKLSDVVKTDGAKPGGGLHNGMKFSELSKKDAKELQRLKTEQPEVFAHLYKAEYGTDWKA